MGGVPVGPVADQVVQVRTAEAGEPPGLGQIGAAAHPELAVSAVPVELARRRPAVSAAAGTAPPRRPAPAPGHAPAGPRPSARSARRRRCAGGSGDRSRGNGPSTRLRGRAVVRRGSGRRAGPGGRRRREAGDAGAVGERGGGPLAGHEAGEGVRHRQVMAPGVELGRRARSCRRLRERRIPEALSVQFHITMLRVTPRGVKAIAPPPTQPPTHPSTEVQVSHPRMPRRILLAATLATTLALPAVQAAQRSAPHVGHPRAADPGAAARTPCRGAHRPTPSTRSNASPGHRSPPRPGAGPRARTPREGRIPGPQTRTERRAARPQTRRRPLHPRRHHRPGPEQFADFLADPAVTADGCLRDLVWTWDARLVPVMSDAHVQAVARRITGLAAAHDGKNTSHLYEMFTYLHAVAYHDFSHDEIDITDAPTVDAIRARRRRLRHRRPHLRRHPDQRRHPARGPVRRQRPGPAPAPTRPDPARSWPPWTRPTPPPTRTRPGATPPSPRSPSTTWASTPATRTPPSRPRSPPTPPTAPPSRPSPATPTSRARPTPGSYATRSASTAASVEIAALKTGIVADLGALLGHHRARTSARAASPGPRSPPG